MQNPPPVQTAPAKSSTGLDENIAALLSYILGLISGLVFFLIEKDSRLVKFHAAQSMVLSGVWIVVGIAIWILSIFNWVVIGNISGLLSFLISIVVGLVAFALGIGGLIAVIMCLIKAFQGQYFKLPVIGNIAEKFSAK